MVGEVVDSEKPPQSGTVQLKNTTSIAREKLCYQLELKRVCEAGWYVHYTIGPSLISIVHYLSPSVARAGRDKRLHKRDPAI